MNIKTIRTKIYIVCILSIILILGLLYMLLSGRYENLQEYFNNRKNNKEKEVEVVETVEPCSFESDCGPVRTEEPKTASEDDNTKTEETEKKEETTTEEKVEETTEVNNEEEKSNEADKEERLKVDITTNSSITKVVNPSLKIDSDYTPEDLVTPSVNQYGEQLLRKEASDKLEEMFEAASNEGIRLFLISGYRDYTTQDDLYRYYINQGATNLESSDSIPGGTEHQLGLSVDLGGMDQVCELQTCFEETSTYEWLKNNSYKYGFIERHPKGKEEYTHIDYNPWSFRYLGVDEATKVYNSGMAVEEYYLVSER